MATERLAVPVPAELGPSAVELASALIRVNTVNPPGNEGEAQELLADALAGTGFDCRLLAAEAGRENLVARLEGESPGPTLCLLGHVDTVPADPSEWSFSPWSGEVVEGEVRGRGAQDMKSQVASEVAACAALARSGWRPRRGALLLVITADEEMGAKAGARWLCKEHPDAVRCDLVLNEGGGTAVEHGGRRFYTLSVGEKGVMRFLVRTHGVAGHASMPRMGDNALLKLAPLLERLHDQPPLEPTAAGLRMLSELGADPAGADHAALAGALARVHAESPELAAWIVEPALGVTLVPTRVWASEKENVIPSRAEALVDCRVPPGMGAEAVRERAEAILGEGDYELEFVEREVGSESSYETPLFDAVAGWVERADPGARVLPTVMAGFSDSHWFRRAFGAVAYGFCPGNAMSLAELEPLVHGADERAKVADIELGARFFFEIAQEVLA